MSRGATRVFAASLANAVALASSACVGVFNDYPAARGQVVDARTGSPIAHAEIVTGDSRVVYTTADGFFTVPLRRSPGVAVVALAPTKGNLFVRAPGYATAHRALHEIPPTGPVTAQEDLGIIRLEPTPRKHI